MIPVSAHVSVEIARLRESGITDLALVGFFPCVGAVVLSEGGAIGETLTACVTLVRPVSRMRAQMGGDRAALRKSSLAHGAFERFFTAVCAQMGGEVGCLSKGFLADRTLVRLFAVVRAQVGLQRGLARVSFATDMA